MKGLPRIFEVIGHKDESEKKLILESLADCGVPKSAIKFIEKPADIR